MIRISQQDSAQAASSYYSTADYLSEGQEIIGRWGGKGALRLGLCGTVDKPSFDRLCNNRHPETGKPLTVRTRTQRTVGYDFTFSVPKSVSLIYALSGEEAILEAFRSSVDETMQEMEAEMKTRLRRGGRDTDRLTGNMVWAEFIHTTSRPVGGLPDPQLHAHVFTFNTTWDEPEKRWKAGQFRDLKRDAPYFQAAFRVRLANRLQAMGLAVTRKRDDFELAGFSPDLLKRFSRRTELIDKVADERGITDAAEKAELGAETREGKQKELGWKALTREWDSRLTEVERTMVGDLGGRKRAPVKTERGESMAVDHAIEHSYVRDAVVPERKLMTEALKRGLGTVTVERAAGELGRRPLIRSQVEGRPMATTEEMLALETKLVHYARRSRGRWRPLGDPNRSCSREWFNDGQKAAVKHVLGSRDGVIVIRGVAGTGKTTLEQEIGEALAEAGRPVVAIAQSTKASREVLRQEAGFAEADTVARFLKDAKMQEAARDGVILVDEASLLGTRDMQRLFEIAHEQQARVVLVGDRRQHRSVAAGEPLKLLAERAGLPAAEVTDIMRQQGSYKKAAKALSEGRTEQAFDELDRLGWIRQQKDEHRNRLLADAYLSAVKEKKPSGGYKTALVVAPTHAEGQQVTTAIRSALKSRGLLDEERMIKSWVPSRLTDAQRQDATEYSAGDLVQFTQNAKGHTKGDRIVLREKDKPPVAFADRYELYRPVELALAVGDRIRVTAGGKTRDGKHRLCNGSLFTVHGFTGRGDIIVDHDWVIGRHFGHITHGYAMTSQASQGVTVDKVFAGMSSESLPAVNQRTAYVALTRGKEQAIIFTDDRYELLKAMQRPEEPMSATDLAGAWPHKPALRRRPGRPRISSRGLSMPPVVVRPDDPAHGDGR
jgi:conjugative relaxase-like TrwC/TraI family protein